MKRADSYGRIGNCDVLLNYQRTQFSLFPEEPGARDHKEVQNMNKYELAVVVSAKIEDDARAAVIEKVKEMITEKIRLRNSENERRILLLRTLRV